jgi:hypothetical protein
MRGCAALVWAALVAVAGAARAQGEAAGDALFNEARARMERGDYETACAQLRESDRLDPAPGTKLNLAACEEKRGRLATAWALYRIVAEQLPAADERVPIARRAADALGPRLPYLTVVRAPGAPPATSVSRDGVAVAEAALGVELPADPGATTIRVTAPGHAPRELVVTLAEAERRLVEVLPGEPLAPRVPAPPPPPAAATEANGSGARTAGLVMGAVGIVATVAGVATAIAAYDRQEVNHAHCSEERNACDQEGADAADAGRVLVAVSAVSFGVGVVGLGAGATLLLTAPAAERGVALAFRW